MDGISIPSKDLSDGEFFRLLNIRLMMVDSTGIIQEFYNCEVDSPSSGGGNKLELLRFPVKCHVCLSIYPIYDRKLLNVIKNFFLTLGFSQFDIVWLGVKSQPYPAHWHE